MIRILHQYVSVKSLLCVLIEAVLVASSLTVAAKIRFWSAPAEFQRFTAMPTFGFQVLIIVLVFQLCFYWNELHDLSAVRTRREQLLRLWQALGSASLLLSMLYYLAPGLLVGRGVFFIGIALVTVSITIAHAVLDLAWRVTGPVENVLIIGSGELSAALCNEISRRGDLNIRLAGLVDGNLSNRGTAPFGCPLLGSMEELEEIAAKNEVSRIIVALNDRRGTLPVQTLLGLRVRGVAVEDAHTALAALTGRVWLSAVRPGWFVFSDGFRRSRLTAALKRTVDVCLAFLGLVLAAPIMTAIAVAIRLDSPGPALFRQKRVGRGGKVFELLKFRSMRADAEAGNGAQWAQKNDPRVTRVGRLIRRYRLDELPQFVNVLRNDMSFVGPRPERPVFVEQLRKEIGYYDERHSVQPGITGWAQVQYPYGASVEDARRKLEYDLFYLKNMSLVFDMAIVLQTVRIVLFGRGAR